MTEQQEWEQNENEMMMIMRVTYEDDDGGEENGVSVIVCISCAQFINALYALADSVHPTTVKVIL